jgi:cobalt-zinc-cadmium resistance protein CzcA
MNALIAFALKHRVLMLVLYIMMFVGGLFAFRQLNIEAYPDPTPPMVDVVTQSPGLRPRKSNATSPFRLKRRPPR